MVKKQIYILLCLLLFSACKKEEGLNPNCHLMDIGYAVFHIKVTDAAGNNLIENGTYDVAKVKVVYDNHEIGGAGRGWGAIKNSITFSVLGTGDKNYFIILDETDTDTLKISAIPNEICNFIVYIPESAIYNKEEFVLDEESLSFPTMTIVK
ncbi:MAG: hypothetical protein ACR2MT_00440 [Aurantibacter sp.]